MPEILVPVLGRGWVPENRLLTEAAAPQRRFPPEVLRVYPGLAQRLIDDIPATREWAVGWLPLEDANLLAMGAPLPPNLLWERDLQWARAVGRAVARRGAPEGLQTGAGGSSSAQPGPTGGPRVNERPTRLIVAHVSPDAETVLRSDVRVVLDPETGDEMLTLSPGFEEAWDPAEHPRNPKGSPVGGEFTVTPGGPPVEGVSARAPKIVTPTKEEAFGTNPKHRYPGACYEMATRYMMTHGGDPLAKFLGPVAPKGTRVTLVHGVVGPKDRRISHAWVELGDKVFDGTEQQFYDKADYYAALEATSEQTYTAEEMWKHMARHKTYGPWGSTTGFFKAAKPGAKYTKPKAVRKKDPRAEFVAGLRAAMKAQGDEPD